MKTKKPLDLKSLTPYGLISIAGFFILCLFLFTRDLGIHIDENNYLVWSIDNPLGDGPTGKQYVFFLINFAVMNTMGVLLGSLRPLTMYFLWSFWFVA